MNHERTLRLSLLIGAFGLVGVGYGIRAYATGAPTTNTLTYAGTLLSGGAPVTGSHTVNVTVLNAADGGTSECSTGATAVTVASNGAFTIPLPTGCTTPIENTPQLWVDVNVDGQDTGTAPISSVPYAITANTALSANTATSATSATTATSATSCSTCTTATSATSATSCTNATNASNATSGSNLAGALLSSAQARGGTWSGYTGNLDTSTTSDQIYFEAEAEKAITTTAAGVGVVTFPQAFPNGLVTVIVSWADTGDYNQPLSMKSDGATKSGFQFQCGLDSTSVTVNYIAIGY